MAFRTNKMPVLQEKSASGSVATFNTALAMPLSSCNIAVNAWQEGTGDPSPVNNRPIHGFSEVNVTANNVVHTIQLGQEVYGAEVDVVNGVMRVTKKIVDLSTITGWMYQANYDRFYSNNAVTDYGITQDTADMAIFENVITSRGSALPCAFVDGVNRVFFANTGYTEIESFLENIINGHYAVVTIKPFDIQLTPTQIETLIGNNTIFADTGDIDLTFKDLDIAKRGNFREVFRLPS